MDEPNAQIPEELQPAVDTALAVVQKYFPNGDIEVSETDLRIYNVAPETLKTEDIKAMTDAGWAWVHNQNHWRLAK